MPPLLEMRSISKEFSGVRALDGVTFDLQAGEFHALVGENGAGKSTLMKILAGVYPAGSYAGEICIAGDVKRFHNVRQAEAAGVAVVFQELSLVRQLTVAENIFLGREPSRFGVININQLNREAAELLADLNLNINPQTSVETLGIGQQQIVEIAKALAQNARILVLDEPTAALTETETETLFEILRRLKKRGVGMIYISHKLEEVFRMGERITVLRDGRAVGTESASALDKGKIIRLMVGREVGDIFPAATHELGETILAVKNLNVFDAENSDKKLIDGVSFAMRKGEVLGIAGLMGAGRSELLTAIFGAWQGKQSGEIFFRGKKVSINSPSDAIEIGIGFVTEDRKRYGLILEQTISNNLTLPALKRIAGRFVNSRARESVAARQAMNDLRVKAGTAQTVAGTLSGGNQQKVVLGKWLLTNPKILLLDEPTRGIDVGAKQEIYAEINRLAKQGLAIVMASSELPEVLGLSDRVLVLHEGRLTGEFTKAEAAPERVMAAATGSN